MYNFHEDPTNLDQRLLNEEEPPKAKITSPHVPFWFAWLLWFVGLSLVVALAGLDHFYYDNAWDIPVLTGASVGVLIGSFFLALATVKLQGRRKE